MEYDKAQKELIVTWNGKTSYIPSTNVASYMIGDGEDRRIVQQAHPMVSGIGSAQVETPMSHVHAGPGKGRTK